MLFIRSAISGDYCRNIFALVTFDSIHHCEKIILQLVRVNRFKLMAESFFFFLIFKLNQIGEVIIPYFRYLTG